jgi:hypothetical protein
MSIGTGMGLGSTVPLGLPYLRQSALTLSSVAQERRRICVRRVPAVLRVLRVSVVKRTLPRNESRAR